MQSMEGSISAWSVDVLASSTPGYLNFRPIHNASKLQKQAKIHQQLLQSSNRSNTKN